MGKISAHLLTTPTTKSKVDEDASKWLEMFLEPNDNSKKAPVSRGFLFMGEEKPDEELQGKPNAP